MSSVAITLREWSRDRLVIAMGALAIGLACYCARTLDDLPATIHSILNWSPSFFHSIFFTFLVSAFDRTIIEALGSFSVSVIVSVALEFCQGLNFSVYPGTFDSADVFATLTGSFLAFLAVAFIISYQTGVRNA